MDIIAYLSGMLNDIKIIRRGKERVISFVKQSPLTSEDLSEVEAYVHWRFRRPITKQTLVNEGCSVDVKM